MKRKLKHFGLLAVISVFTVALTSSYLAFALSSIENTDNRITARFQNGVICGDHICKAGEWEKMQREELEKRKANAEDLKAIAQGKVPKAPETKTSAPEAPALKTPTKEAEKAVSDLGSLLKLSRASVPVAIPLHEGFYDGKPVYFIVTDSSEQKHADIITKAQGWKVELAPPLAKTPAASLDPVYVFTNGIKGNGIHGFQGEVFASTPAQPEKYSSIRSHIHVTWKDGQNAEVLDSEQKILDAQKAGKVELQNLDVILNMPQIVWPGGQMPLRDDKNISDDSPYVGGQVLNIDTDKMKVTFVAHRGWGPDGRSIYYIVTDATPEGPAKMMGVTTAQTLAKSLVSPAAVDLFQFMNGIKGSGPMGFQAGIGGSAPGQETYSPLWRISMIGWKDPSSARILETVSDINALKADGKIDVSLARPMDSDHVVNCPFIDPFQ